MAEKEATEKGARANHVVIVNGQPVYSVDDTVEDCEMKASAVAMDHVNKCIASGAKQNVRIVRVPLGKEVKDAT